MLLSAVVRPDQLVLGSHQFAAGGGASRKVQLGLALDGAAGPNDLDHLRRYRRSHFLALHAPPGEARLTGIDVQRHRRV